MRTLQHRQQKYNQLEQRSSQVRKLVNLELKRLWQVISDFWQSSKEPRVRERMDQDGNMYWQVYDPWQDAVLRFDDEQNVRIWLEEQHYRQSPQLWDLR